MHAWLAIYLKGVCMGAADIVPGVSGGTIALIVGIYERLVRAIASLHPRSLRHLRTVHTQAGRSAFLDELYKMDVGFLLVLGLGIMSAVLVVSRVILFAFTTYPAHVNAFFFGLIAASAVIIGRDVTFTTTRRLLVALAGFTVAFVVSGTAAGSGAANLPTVFLAGAIAISAMILPGISGAAFLYILGQYEYLLDALRTFVDASLAIIVGGSPARVLDAGIVVGTFMIGAFLGLLTTARIVSWALAHYRMATMAFLVSLMIGALRMPVIEIRTAVGMPGVLEGLTLVLVVIVGAAAVLALDRWTGSLEYV